MTGSRDPIAREPAPMGSASHQQLLEATDAPVLDGSRSAYVTLLARELVDDIELGRLPPTSLLRKGLRLARIRQASDWEKWLTYELVGYDTSDAAFSLAQNVGRVTNPAQRWGYWGPLAEIEAMITAKNLQLQALRVPDISFSVSSANPNEWVTGGALNPTRTPDHAILGVIGESRQVAGELPRLTAILTKAISWLHSFALAVYHEKAFSGLAESIFGRFKGRVDGLLAQYCGDVLRKVPTIYDRLGEGDPEAVSQALNTCRRIIDTFADTVFPPTDATREVGGKIVELGTKQKMNRLKAHIDDHVQSSSRRTKLKQTAGNLYERVSTGVHADVSIEEARSLFLETYLLLGEVLEIAPPPSRPAAPGPLSPAPNQIVDTGQENPA